ncbi:MAG: ATP-dependent helicase [Lachnospiraceae bacterium]|nr:ATP-dependent helicase [Lachnospiraceae bacterium]
MICRDKDLSFLESLNDKQRMAVCTDSGACLVLAGPGSGKTHTITARIKYLIRNMNVLPEKILVITFTKDAAKSMEQRFMESGNYGNVVFGTFHSVFYSILRMSAGYSSKKLLSESYKKRIISKIISELIPGFKGNTKANTDDISSEFICAASIYKNTGNLQKSKSKISKEYAGFFDTVFNKYEEYIRARKLLDYDDMIFECLHFLRIDDFARKYWQDRFSHILIDEYQDINPMQFECVNLLCGSNVSLFAVGDDDQSIYGFRGSDPSCLKEFINKYDAKIIDLNVNYRSYEGIVKAANTVMGDNKNRLYKTQYSYYTDGYNEIKDCVYIDKFDNKAAEFEFITESLKNYKTTNNKFDIAVLFRTNVQMQAFASYLTDKSIKFNIKDKYTCIYDHPIALDVLAYMEISLNSNSEKIFRIINKPLRYVNREALMEDEGDIITSAIAFYKDNPNLPKGNLRIKELLKLKNDLNFIKDKPLYLQISYIKNKIGLLSFYVENTKNKIKVSEYEEVFAFLYEEARKYDTLSEWKKHIEDYREEYVGSSENVDKNNGFVNLMTVHASKGLEFDICFIPGVNEGSYPSGRMPDSLEVEEERRVFYVAMTRAKRLLHISYISKTKGGTLYPSRFLQNILDQSSSSSNSSASKYSSNASATFSYSSSSSM